MATDLRIALRTLRRDRAFTAGVIATLALAIGANASVFTVVRSVLLRPLPMTRPSELVSLSIVRRESSEYPLNLANFLDFRSRTRSLADMAATASWNANLSGEADPERIPGVRVTANYFRMTGVNAILGRTLQPDDDTPGRQKVVVLTASLWQNRYGGDRTIIGRTIRLNGEPFAVVGVLPADFAFGYNTAQLAAPMLPDADPTRDRRTAVSSLRVTARMKPGVTPGAAQADMDSIASQLRREHPVENGAWLGTRVIPLADQLVANSRGALLLLMSAVALVLLIACANIAGLMLSRGAARRHELSVRLALGAGRAVLFRQFLLESLILTITGGALGMFFARAAVPLLLTLSPASLPRLNEIRVDGVVWVAVIGVTCGAGLLFGAISAFFASRGNLNLSARSATATVSQSRARNFFVIAEFALALVLLLAAGLVLRSFVELKRVSPGFDTSHLLTTRLSLPGTRYKTAADVVRFSQQLHPVLDALPGVRSSGAISILPLSGPLATSDYTIVGRPAPPHKPVTDYRMIDIGYFPAMGIPILKGRGFNDSDREDSNAVMIVNETLARQQWPTGDAVGAHLLFTDDGADRTFEIVGIAADVRATAIDAAPEPAVFVPIPQVSRGTSRFLTNSMFWVIRTGPPPEALAQALGAAIHKIDPEVAASNRVGMEFYLDRTVADRRFLMQLLTVFAFAALLLSTQGIYALLSQTLGQQTREIGIRLALGAHPAEVARLVTRFGIMLAAPGLAGGLLTFAAASGLISSLLYRVKPWDPGTVIVVLAVLALTAIVASLGPARRAMRVDPATALRGE